MPKTWEEVVEEHDKMLSAITKIKVSLCWIKRIGYIGGTLIFLVVAGSLGTIASLGVPLLVEIHEKMGVIELTEGQEAEYRIQHEEDHEEVLCAIEKVGEDLETHMKATD